MLFFRFRQRCFILVLQQFDGNILGPKILGNSTGLSAFWVIVAILLGGGLFGFVGMVMGVPAFAVLYYVAELILNSKLERKNLPASSKMYDPVSYVDDDGCYMSGREHFGGGSAADGADAVMEEIVEKVVEDLEKEARGPEAEKEQ